MKLVSDLSQKEIDDRRRKMDANDAFSQALRDLTANLIRVARGAGKAYEVVGQANDLLLSAKAYRDAFGHWPSSQSIEDTLSHREESPGGDDLFALRQYAVQRVVSGSLRFAAARIAQQPLQASHGDNEIDDGLRMYGEWLDEVRRKNRERELALRAAARPAKKTSARKTAKRPPTKF